MTTSSERLLEMLWENPPPTPEEEEFLEETVDQLLTSVRKLDALGLVPRTSSEPSTSSGSSLEGTSDGDPDDLPAAAGDGTD